MFQLATSRSFLELSSISCSSWIIGVHVDDAGADEVLENVGHTPRPNLHSSLYLLVHALGEIMAVATVDIVFGLCITLGNVRSS